MDELNLNYIQHIHSLFSIPPSSRTQNHLEEIMEFTKNNKFLNKICEEHNSDRILWESSRYLTLEIYEKNEMIIEFGEIGDRFYIILKGKVSVVVPTKSIKRSNSTKQDILQGLKRMQTGSQEDLELPPISESDEKVNTFIKGIKRNQTILDFDYLTNFGIVEESEQVRTLTTGDCFGELALLNNKPRTATIEAKTNVYLAVLSKRDFSKVLLTHTSRSLNERVSHLKSLPGFNTATKLNLQKLAYTFTEKTYKKDQIVFAPNDPAHILYFIKSGEFKISKSETVTTSKYPNRDALLKLSKMRSFSKKTSVREVIKGINEIFGYEELVEKKDIRERKCVCVSHFAQVYEVKIEEVKRFPLYSEILSFFTEKYSSDFLTVSLKSNPLVRSVKNTSTTYRKPENSSTVSDLLYSMRKKRAPYKLVPSKYSSSSSLPSPCETLHTLQPDPPKPKSPPALKKQKNRLSLQFINNALGIQELQTPVFVRKGYRKSTLESSSARRDLEKFSNIFSY